MIAFEKRKQMKKMSNPFVVATIIGSTGSTPRKTGSAMVIFETGEIEGSIGGGEIERKVIKKAVSLMRKGNSKTVKFNLSAGRRKKFVSTKMICGGTADVFFNVQQPPVKLIVCGAGHIGQNLIKLANLLEWNCEVIDNRKKFVKNLNLKNVKISVVPYVKTFSRVDADKNSCVVIVTHNHSGDVACLEGALKTKAFYIGMIGSRKKVAENFKKIMGKGTMIDKRVFSPIGLDLGGDSPGEIALCIISEIMKVKNGRKGRHLRMREGV